MRLPLRLCNTFHTTKPKRIRSAAIIYFIFVRRSPRMAMSHCRVCNVQKTCDSTSFFSVPLSLPTHTHIEAAATQREPVAFSVSLCRRQIRFMIFDNNDLQWVRAFRSFSSCAFAKMLVSDRLCSRARWRTPCANNAPTLQYVCDARNVCMYVWMCDDDAVAF